MYLRLESPDIIRDILFFALIENLANSISIFESGQIRIRVRIIR